MILSFINIRKVPRAGLKTSGFALGFSTRPSKPCSVNEHKIMFDPYIEKAYIIYSTLRADWWGLIYLEIFWR